MKKNFHLILSIGILLVIIMIASASDRASGATSKDESVGINEQNLTEQIGPPWFDEAWHYRRPVIISSSVYIPTYYQVLIKLDNSNFDFNLSNTDGSDIRFTDSSGKNLISYWIESWDKQKESAYIWVLVSTIPPQPYDKTIYLYYNNPTASSTSSGSSTFDFFDDFLQFSGASCPSGGTTLNTWPSSKNENKQDGIFRFTNSLILTDPWCVINGSPSVSSSILTLSSGSGIKTNNLFQLQEAVGYLTDFGLGGGKAWAGFFNKTNDQQTMIGILQKDLVYSLFLINHDNDVSAPLGVNDWLNPNHTYEVRWDSSVSRGYIDHTYRVSNNSQVPSIQLPVTLYNDIPSTAMTVDWVYVRQYHNPEPTYIVGIKQGLVDLGLTMSDSPDPIPQNKELTYQIAITNTSSIEAPEVVVTDTLPESVQFIRAIPAERCSHVSVDVVCNLSTIGGNQTARLTIMVYPTVDGVITNSAIVGSPGYDLDMSNNEEDVTTLVDTISPNVNWENPVLNGEKFTTNGGWVGLEVSATDNDRVAWVEFWYWDHLPIADPKGKVSIGIDYSYPYQMQFNSNVLVPNEQYQVFVQAADRAGNISDIYTEPHPVIYIERISLFFLYLPIAIK